MATQGLDTEKLRREGKLRHTLSLVEVRYLRGPKGYIKQFLNKKEINLTFKERFFYSLLRRHQLPGFLSLLRVLSPLADPIGEKGFVDTVQYLEALSESEPYDPLRAQEWEQEARKLAESSAPSELLRDFINKNLKQTKPTFLHRFRASGLFSELNSLSESISYAAFLDCTLVYAFPADQNEYSATLLNLLSPLEGVLFQRPPKNSLNLEDITETSHQWFNQNKFTPERNDGTFAAPYALSGEVNRLILETIGWAANAKTEAPNKAECITKKHGYFIRSGDKVGTESIPTSNQTIAQQIAIDHASSHHDAREQIIICGDDARACEEITCTLNRILTRKNSSASTPGILMHKSAIAHKQPHSILTAKGYSHKEFQDYPSGEIRKGFENMFFTLNSLLECDHFSGDPLCNLIQFACRCQPMRYTPSTFKPFFP